MESQPNNNVDEPARIDHSQKEKSSRADLTSNGENAMIDSFRNDDVEIYSNNGDDSHPI